MINVLLAVGFFGGVNLFDAQNGAHLRRINETVVYPEWSPNDALIASPTYPDKLVVCEPFTGNVIRRWKSQSSTLAWSHDGSTLGWCHAGQAHYVGHGELENAS